MNILVTGGAGFIGNHVVLALRNLGHSVSVVDCVNDYYDPALKEARLLRLDPTVTIHRVDITDRPALEEVFSNDAFDAVCHLAAQAGVRYSFEHPEVYIKTNYEGTFNIYDLANKYSVPHVVNVSTSSVYGKSTDMPFVETNNADTAMSVYSATKRAGEILGHSYHHLHGLNVTCLRFFNVYGPWGRPDSALYKFTKHMLAGEKIDVYNNGDMKRDFTYIDDIVDGFVKAVEKPLGYEIINLGNGEPIELMHFIGLIEKELGLKADIHFMPMQPGDVANTYADTQKASKLLGFTAKTSVEEGVRNFVAWYKSYYTA